MFLLLSDNSSRPLARKFGPYQWKLVQLLYTRSLNSSLFLVPWIVLQYIPRNMHTVFALLCFVVVIHWLIFPYPSGLLHWHCGNLTIAPVPAKQPWWMWINTSCEFIMNDCVTTTKQSTTKPCAYFLGYTVVSIEQWTLSTGSCEHLDRNNVFLICYISSIRRVVPALYCHVRLVCLD